MTIRKRRLIEPFLAVLLTVTSAPPLRAQTIRFRSDDSGPSHIEVPLHGPANGRLEEFLKGRGENADAYKNLDDILKNLNKHFSDEDIKAFKKEGILDRTGRPPSLDDPKARQLLEKWLENQQQRVGQQPQPGGFVPDKGMIELLEKLMKETPEGKGFTTPNPIRPPVAGNPPTNMPPFNPPPPGLSRPLPNQPPPELPPPSVSQPAKQEELREGLSKFVEKMREGPLGNSPTLRKIGSDLSRPILQRNSEGGDGEGGLLGQLPRLGEYIPFKRLFSGDGLPSFRKPDWSGPRMPAVGAPSMGGMSAPSEGTILGVLWIALAVVVLIVLWKFLGGKRSATVQALQPAWRLGPWPVDPAAVSTRQDLIRAFEYLSLLLLGPTARAWNHLEIAEKLGEQESAAALERRHAASHLAALYEQARYAPPEEPLPDGELTGARRDLCLLAGVASA